MILQYFKKYLKTSITVCVLLFFLILHFSIIYVFPFGGLRDFQKKPYSVTIYDRNMSLVQITSAGNGTRRQFTPFDQIPEAVKNAFLKSEDNRFYSHGGVDFKAVVRAFKQNTSELRTVSGASTITMQLARIISPSRNRSFFAKIKDCYNAWRIEARLTKNQIYEYYLNSIPFGANTEGITSACRYYFDCELTELNQEQILALAVIPRNPTSYNPIIHPDKCAQAASLLGEKSPEEILKGLNCHGGKEWPFNMPHYIEYLKTVYGDDFGRTITTLNLACDLKMQDFAQYQIYDAMRKTENSRIENAAAIAYENKTGRILLWVGSPDWFDNEHSGQIDGVLVKNQMGSSMKPFLYCLALDKGLKPTDVLPDIPTSFGSEKVYIPLNFNNRFNGPVLLRTALASSLNVPAVLTLSNVGVANYHQALLSLGFDSLDEEGLKADLGLALGAGEVSLLELGHAFSVFANDGKLIPLSYTDTSTADSSKIQQIYTQDSARLICSILSDKKARAAGFGFSQTFETSYPSIFKTGTANQYQNIVALGSTDDYTVAVWMGNHNGNTVMGKTGSSLPATIGKNILDQLTNKKSPAFKNPENFTKTKICQLSGMAPCDHCPVTVEEYVQNDTLNDFSRRKCDWHTNINGTITTNYPAEYQKWISKDLNNSSINYSSSSLKIVSPKNGARFFKSTGMRDNQKITVEVTGGLGDGQLLVFADNLPPQAVERPFIFTLPVTRGSHKIRVELEGESDEIEYLVE